MKWFGHFLNKKFLLLRQFHQGSSGSAVNSRKMAALVGSNFFFFSGVQFITPMGPRQSLLLAKDPGPAFVKIFYTPSVRVQTHQPKSLEAYKGRVNTITITPSFVCYVFKQLIINKPTVTFQPVNN